MQKQLAVYLIVILAAASAAAETGTAYVATVHGRHAYSITGSGRQLYYSVQPDTEYTWYNADGSPATYTRSGVTANRDGMKTVAATDAAYGVPLHSLKLSFQYASDDMTDENGYAYGNYPDINIHLTDGNGNYATWSANMGLIGFTRYDPVAGRSGWEQVTLDCTSFADDSTFGRIIESTNESVLAIGYLYNIGMWSVVKDWTVAGFYTEQVTPTGDWDDWGPTLWSDISEAGDTTPENPYGISLVWGDTIGSMFGDYDSGYVGASAERKYGYQVNRIDNWTVNANGTEYEIAFAADSIPEPATLALLGIGAWLLPKRRL